MGAEKQYQPLPPQLEASDLRPYRDAGGDHLVHAEALRAWSNLLAAAQRDSVSLYIVSAFRGITRQAEIIARKRARGLTDCEIFRYSAPPGYSEHHTGRALDLNAPDCPPLEETFAATPAFAWLSTHATTFGFHLSYPTDNPYGLGYEPWHWCWWGELPA